MLRCVVPYVPIDVPHRISLGYLDSGRQGEVWIICNVWIVRRLTFVLTYFSVESISEISISNLISMG